DASSTVCPSARSAAATLTKPFFVGEARKPWTRTIGYCVGRPDGTGPIAVSASSEAEEAFSSVGAEHAKRKSDEATKRRDSFMTAFPSGWHGRLQQRVCPTGSRGNRGASSRPGDRRPRGLTPAGDAFRATENEPPARFGPPIRSDGCGCAR